MGLQQDQVRNLGFHQQNVWILATGGPTGIYGRFSQNSGRLGGATPPPTLADLRGIVLPRILGSRVDRTSGWLPTPLWLPPGLACSAVDGAHRVAALGGWNLVFCWLGTLNRSDDLERGSVATGSPSRSRWRLSLNPNSNPCFFGILPLFPGDLGDKGCLAASGTSKLPRSPSLTPIPHPQVPQPTGTPRQHSSPAPVGRVWVQNPLSPAGLDPPGPALVEERTESAWWSPRYRHLPPGPWLAQANSPTHHPTAQGTLPLPSPSPQTILPDLSHAQPTPHHPPQAQEQPNLLPCGVPPGYHASGFPNPGSRALLLDRVKMFSFDQATISIFLKCVQIIHPLLSL